MNALAPSPHAAIGAVPSLLKWSGGKRSQAARIAALAPPHRRYHEPFLGGGALLYLMAHDGAAASDLYRPLIDFWLMARDRPDDLIADYAAQWGRLQQDLPAYFYEVRTRFNRDQRPTDLNFLMRTCVNGIARFSASGAFNNSFHLSRKGMAHARFAQIVRRWSRRIRGVDFRTCDYRDALLGAEAGDFVYLDPPYAGNHQRYIGDIRQDKLCAALEALSSRGVKWALSFDGRRGAVEYASEIPRGLYRRRLGLVSGYSAVSKVLNGPVETVSEALYLNYD